MFNSREIVSPEGLRVDGRRATDLRRISQNMSIFPNAEGSAFLQIGNTKCLAAVYGPAQPSKKSATQHDKASLIVHFTVASFSSGIRRQQDRFCENMASIIKSAFEPILLMEQFPRSQIDLYLQIIQLDGGALHTAINAATLAFMDAGIPMKDYVVACSAGFANDTVVLDLNYIEENANVPCLTLAISPKNGAVCACELNSGRLHLENLEEVIETAKNGAIRYYQNMVDVIKEHTEKLAQTALP